ncbi:cupin domain-containing protein [Marisediminicola antarctica]|nr:cupin domain-containing protein [Marisediminicola antarctica]
MESSHPWARQALWWSERQRSRPLLWPAGESWFSNDPLGPLPHTHPGASEVYFVASGELHVTVGTTDLVLSAGDYCLIPPGTFHSPQNLASEDLRMLALVSPNVKGERWKTAPFSAEDFEGQPLVGNVFRNTALPDSAHIRGEPIHLSQGSLWSFENEAADTTIWVVEGDVEVTVGMLAGRIEPSYHVTAMAGVPGSIRAISDAIVLVLEAYGDEKITTL